MLIEKQKASKTKFLSLETEFKQEIYDLKLIISEFRNEQLTKVAEDEERARIAAAEEKNTRQKQKQPVTEVELQNIINDLLEKNKERDE